MTARYGDEALFKMLEAAKKIPSTEAIATKLQAEKFRGWLGKKSPDKVFELLGLDKAGEAVLINPQFSTWLNYLKIFSKENPSQKRALVVQLRRYRIDFSVAAMIDEAMKNSSTVKIAKMVQSERLKNWLRIVTSLSEAFLVLIFSFSKTMDNTGTGPSAGMISTRNIPARKRI